jgi:hypothetical protein
MQRSLSTLLHVQRLALKTEWARRLRNEPRGLRVSGLDGLDGFMDDTLDELEQFVQLRPTSRWFSLHRTHLLPLHKLCSCGLNPLLDYFSAGGEALQDFLAVTKGLSERENEKICKGWHFIAQSEMHAVCSLCTKICAPALSFPVAFASELER